MDNFIESECSICGEIVEDFKERNVKCIKHYICNECAQDLVLRSPSQIIEGVTPCPFCINEANN